MPAPPKSRPNHLAEWDAARGVLMLMGVLVHAADIYGIKRWTLNDPPGHAAYSAIVEGIHLFRMPAFFWIAGFFVAMSMQKLDLREFFKRRSQRLLIPLISTALTFNLVQRYWLSMLPDENTHSVSFIGHLWFLVDLFVLSALAVLLARPAGRFDRWSMTALIPVKSPAPLLLVLAGCTTAAMLGVLVLQDVTGTSLRLWRLTSLSSLAHHAGFFAFGILAYRSTLLRETFFRVNPAWLIPAVLVGVWLGLYSEMRWSMRIACQSVASWIAVAAILSLFRRHFGEAGRFKAWLSEASYPIYLSHHFIVILTGGMLLSYEMPAFAKFLAVVTVTFLLSGAFAELVRRHNWLYWMYMGRPRPVSQSAGAIRAASLERT